MSDLALLDAADDAQRAAWLARWRAWPAREVNAHPDYVRLFARPGDRSMAAAMSTVAGGVLFPFILRPLAGEPWAAPGEARWDLVTPYGYGGPYAWGATPDDAAAFWAALDRALAERQVVTSFVRLSLFEDELLPFAGAVETNRSNVVRSLDLAPEALWSDYSHKVRKNVTRARAGGLTVDFDETGASIEPFLDIYYATMDRRGADEGFYFPRAFFETIVARLAGGFVFANVKDAGRVVSTELVLLSALRAYSFLGGTHADAMAARPNDLLKHEVALWARARGKRSYVLGGGATASDEDGIYRYKLAFAPEGVVPFRTGTRTHDVAAAADLEARRRAFEAQRGVDWSPRAGHFPRYRA